MSAIGVSANRLEILQIAKAVAEEKSIDQRIVIEAMQEAIEKAAKAKYGQEHDIRAKIDTATGEQTLWRVQTVVADENFEDEAKQLRLAEAKKIDPTAPHETMLVVDAGTGQNALSQVQEFHQAVGLTGLTVTKLDGTAKGGVLFNIASRTNVPIRYIGVGEKIDDLRPFEAKDFVSALFDDEH